jgi:hypothetical protein
MKYVNGFSASPRFSLCSLPKDIPLVVDPGDQLFTEDLKKAYYKVLIAKKSRRFQCFYWKGKFYEAAVLLFGFCQAPFIFTKICRPIVRFLGALLIKLLNYIDDWFFSDKPEKLAELQSLVHAILGMLGWLLNDKGEGPGLSVKFLGVVVDTVAREFKVPEAKKLKTERLINVVLEAASRGEMVSSKRVSSLAGTITSLRVAIPSASVWSRLLYQASSWVDPECDVPVRVSGECVDDLHVFIRLLKQDTGAPFMNFSHELDLWTDAGETGWGAQTMGIFSEGVFDDYLIGTSSTFRELSALIAAVQAPPLRHLLVGKVVRVNMDSAAGIANLVKGGGAQTPPHGSYQEVVLCM